MQRQSPKRFVYSGYVDMIKLFKCIMIEKFILLLHRVRFMVNNLSLLLYEILIWLAWYISPHITYLFKFLSLFSYDFLSQTYHWLISWSSWQVGVLILEPHHSLLSGRNVRHLPSLGVFPSVGLSGGEKTRELHNTHSQKNIFEYGCCTVKSCILPLIIRI